LIAETVRSAALAKQTVVNGSTAMASADSTVQVMTSVIIRPLDSATSRAKHVGGMKVTAQKIALASPMALHVTMETQLLALISVVTTAAVVAMKMVATTSLASRV
jgi:hypothetical protein